MIQLSTGAKKFLLDNAGLKDIFSDFVIKIYTGVPPNSADDGASGTLLVTITKESKTEVTKQKYQLTLNDVTAGNEYRVGINGNYVSYTAQTGDDKNAITAKLTSALKKLCGDDLDTGLHIEAKNMYLNYTITDLSSDTGSITIESNLTNYKFNVSTTTNITVSEVVSSYNGLHFIYDSTSGMLKKDPSETWSGVCVASGIAGYFRIQMASDNGLQSSIMPRLQGTIGTSNADMLVTSTNFNEGATQTIDFASLDIPLQ